MINSKYMAMNLRLLCSYVGSIAECCRRIGINRQQFSKYLNGNTQPSMSSLRKVCDYFGVDTDEIDLPPAQFKELVSDKKSGDDVSVLFDAPFPGDRYSQHLQHMMNQSVTGLRPYLGDYYYYYMTPSYNGYISKGFARLTVQHGVGVSHFYERAEPGQAMLETAEIGKFVGVVFMLGERLQIVDYSVHCQRAVSQTILYGATKGRVHLLSGLTMGIQGRNARIPFTTRVVFEKLGDQLSLREKLREVTLLPCDSDALSPAILSRLTSPGSIDNPHIFSVDENY